MIEFLALLMESTRLFLLLLLHPAYYPSLWAFAPYIYDSVVVVDMVGNVPLSLVPGGVDHVESLLTIERRCDSLMTWLNMNVMSWAS